MLRRGPHLEGAFETHLTVRTDTQIEALSRWAADHELGFLHILLDRGRTPSQPMVTRRSRGTDATQLHAATELAARLQAAGFSVVRVKVEAALQNEGIPQSDEDAAQNPDEYFEHHVKLVLPHGADLAPITDVARRHHAHLSRNARRVRNDGYDERFLTQRCSGVGAVAALQTLARLLSELGREGVARVETELVVYDSNLEADAGWTIP